MFLLLVIWLLGVVSLTSAAAVHPVREAQSVTLSSPTCPLTVTQYVTVTHTPPVVTIAVPNIADISRSLASASTIDSIVVVEQSQDAPVSNHPDTTIPTFIHTIVASAFEATEISGTGSTAVYLSVGSGTVDSSHKPSHSVVIGVTTISVVPHALATSTSLAAARSTSKAASSPHESFAGLSNDWNGTRSTFTNASPVSESVVAAGTLPTSNSVSTTTTAITYIATVTEEVTATMSPALMFGGVFSSMFPSLLNWPSGGAGVAKRQACVLVSADVGNHQTATWCNNWDGSTTMTYTSWETTITPGHFPGSTTSSSSSVVTSTVSAQPVTTVSQSIVPVQSTPSVPVTASSGQPAPSCGQVGPFDINFDNLPEQSVFPNETAGSPPIFNPFDHFFWEAGWSYGPPPSQPYSPHSGDQLAIYNTTLSDEMSSGQNANSIVRGSFSAGPRSSLDQYWFNATSAWVGCQNNLTSPTNICDFVAEGYIWNPETQQEKLIITQHFAQPLCETEHCDLQLIHFGESFIGLCTLAFYANINGQLKNFYVDDLQLGWWNNTCDAGLMRISSRK